MDILIKGAPGEGKTEMSRVINIARNSWFNPIIYKDRLEFKDTRRALKKIREIDGDVVIFDCEIITQIQLDAARAMVKMNQDKIKLAIYVTQNEDLK